MEWESKELRYSENEQRAYLHCLLVQIVGVLSGRLNYIAFPADVFDEHINVLIENIVIDLNEYAKTKWYKNETDA